MKDKNIVMIALFLLFFIGFGYGYMLGNQHGNDKMLDKVQDARNTTYSRWAWNNYVKGNTYYKTPYYLDYMLEEIQKD